MHEPIGVSGVQTVPNSLHSRGSFAPRRIAPHSQAGLSSAGRLDEAEAPLGVVSRRTRAAARARSPAASRGRAIRTTRAVSNTAATSACALRLPYARHGPNVLVLDLGAALVDLPHQHQDRLGDVERLEAGDHDRLAIVAGERLVGLRADHRADMRGADEAVDQHRASRPRRRGLRGWPASPAAS